MAELEDRLLQIYLTLTLTYAHTLTHRHPTNAIEDESLLRRDIEEELSEQWEDFEVGNAERVARYEAQLAEWKSYQKTRVSSQLVSPVFCEHLRKF